MNAEASKFQEINDGPLNTLHFVVVGHAIDNFNVPVLKFDLFILLGICTLCLITFM